MKASFVGDLVVEACRCKDTLVRDSVMKDSVMRDSS